MPKVRQLTKEKRFQSKMDDIASECEFLLLKNNVTKTEVAELVGITHQAVSHQFKTGNISLDTFVAVMNLVGVSGERMERLVNIE